MLGKLALQRTNVRFTHLTALAVMAALVVGLFGLMGSASAAPSPQSVAPIPANACVANPGIVLGFTDHCDVEIRHFDSEANALVVSDSSSDVVTVAAQTPNTVWRITADADTPGSRKINVVDYGSDGVSGGEGTAADKIIDELTVTVARFGITKVEVVGDTDNRVAAGKPIMVRATLRSESGGAGVRLTVPTTGLSIDTGTATSQFQDGAVTDGMATFTVNTAGAPANDYELTFEADDNTVPTDNVEGQAPNVTKKLLVTIGDPGVALASATLTLGQSARDVPYTPDNEAIQARDTAAAASGSINLVVAALDSTGGKTNADAIDQVIVIAPGGTVTYTGTGDFSANQSGATIKESDVDTPDVDNVGQSTGITVGKADTTKAGQITVYAIVSGSGGAATTESRTLNFSGTIASISLADATDTLRSVNVETDDEGNVVNDTVKLALTGEDSGGIPGDPGDGYSINITNPDGTRVNSNKIEFELGGFAAGKRNLTVTGKGAPDSALKAGEYTVTLTRGELEASANFSVAGPATNIGLDVDNKEPDEVGGHIMLTATVTDANGIPVVDNTEVTITASDVRGDGDSVLVLALPGVDNNSGKAETKDGVATARLVVVGSGSAVVSASSGAGFEAIVITSTAGDHSAEAMPAEEASLSCLSETNAYSTWTCEVDSSASEVFGWVNSRGASAIHLWNGSAWVRYSVVEGATVPGSSDFQITQYNQLYISN